MRVVAHSNLATYWLRHPDAKLALRNWEEIAKRAEWRSMQQVVDDLSGTKVLNGERARFAIAGGSHRLVVAFNFKRQIAYVKFIGTHAEYDRIDALKVEQF